MEKTIARKLKKQPYYLETNSEDWDIIADWLYGKYSTVFVQNGLVKIHATNRFPVWLRSKIKAHKGEFIAPISLYCREFIL